ncbi:biotin--[acetyl-CoA-carboxylase] ligase [Pyramidobacter sp.]|uniref:biotin--[acetyl-CoA-carboxylase] ligase n=1 Tax=Pyramidobacter sp. TaxID=1943581 RepID=UPI0025F3DEED|nr:biotin--[acetyl-CoA-carboxylase] ligase [Pyramidobacter sp.]MCI7404736.1 biotin--[acetyl-CoA-carboxylase] ligase [Pyramidobacter sp.]MDY3211990.1 biotin--[acetyl-CoA-carboxylase] ligase [Pyramidobacter sp.]
MTTKEEVLKTLELSQGRYVSGEALARRLSLSRNAVWRAVKSLQDEGCSIDAVTRRGYRLNETPDLLSPQAVEKYFSRRAACWDVEVRKTVTSTNTVLKTMAEGGAPEGKILVAAEQTAGRGRMERRFYSPAGSGVYMSLLLRPSCGASQSLYVTTAAAVAVAEAIEHVTGQRAQIKWVNDVYLRGKKACGILTEAAFDMETNRLAYAVLGIGVNMRPPAGGFPDELEPIVTSVFGEADYDPVLRNRIVAEIIERFWRSYENLGEKAFLQGYRERSFLSGKDVDVVSGAERRPARALDIDGEFRLHVRYEDGAEEYLQSGEVSVKPRGGSA